MVLNLAGLQSNRCNVEARIFSQLHRLKLGGVESSRDAMERMSQSSISRCFRGSSKSLAGGGAMYPHEMPARLTNHPIESRRCNFFRVRPVIANGFLRQAQLVRQTASFAQEHRMRRHASGLFFADGANVMPEFSSAVNGGAGISVKGDCHLRSSNTLAKLTFVRSFTASKEPVGKCSLAGLKRNSIPFLWPAK
jgi:hypothetical protein